MSRVLEEGPRRPPALHRVLSAIRRVLGVPDYEAYVAHLRRAHPEVVPLPPEEYLRRRLDDRYSRPGARCC